MVVLLLHVVPMDTRSLLISVIIMCKLTTKCTMFYGKADACHYKIQPLSAACGNIYSGTYKFN